MADKKFDLVFNASLEVGQVKSAVASLTKSLENAGAKIPQSMASNLNRMIQSLNTELNKLEGMTDIQLDPKNAKNVGKSYEKIFQTFQQIKAALGDIHRTAGIDPEKFFPSEIANNISKAAQAVQKYKKAMEAGIKTEEHTKATKDIADAEKKVKSLNDKLDEAARKRQSSSIVKDQLQETRKKLQAEKDQAEAEDKAAKEAQKTIQDRIKSQEKLSQVEEEIAKKKKKQQEAVNKAAKANEIKNERESMKQAKGKGTDTKIYRDAVASYAESTAEVQKLQNEIDQLEAEYTQLSQTATVTADEIAAANERATKAATELTNAQKRLNKNQTDIDAADTKYTAATAEVKTLVPEVQKAEDALNQLIQKREQLESSFEQSIFDELIQELEKLGIKLPDTERNMEGVERALESMAAEARGKVATALKGVKDAAEGIDKPLGEVGKKASDVGELGEQAKRAEQDMENLKNQVLDFFSITNTIQIFKNAIRDAFDTVKELDAAMTETAVVTDFSVGDMWDKLPQYSEEATKLGASIKSLYEATTLYYQQGLNSEQAMGVGIETMKMARIANMDAAAATEAMTAALRGFNMEINEISATRINDVYSELAAITAADTSQIATAMSKTASIAESANMEFETTAALLAQIIETTQEAPETAGTALKTIIARFTEVKQLFSEGMLTGEDSEGEEININKIDAALKTVGISLKDFLNGTKGIDDIFLELASKWDTLDLATQRYIATTAAGSRQQSRFLAMMGNYDRTMELVNAATNSAGASQKQFGKTLESLDAKLQKLKNAWDTFTMGLANNEAVKLGVDLITKILESVNNLTDNLGGLGGAFAKLAITITALKIGKNIFNSFFDPETVKKAPTLFKSATTIIQSGFQKIGVSAQEATSETLAFNTGAQKIASGMMIAGTAASLLANYFRAIGLDELAEGIEMIGGGFIVLGGILTVVNGAAQAMGLTFIELGIKIWTALAPILPIIIAVGVALGAVALVLKKVYDNSAAGKLKAAKKATEAAGEAAQDAAEAYNNLTNAINSIDDKTEALSELTRGTNEWREAVIALNSEILKLVETYPELAGFIENEGGVLKIDYEKTATNKYGEEQTANDILESYLRKQTETQQIYNRKQIDEKQAEIDLEYSKAMRDFADSLSFIDIEKAEKESETGSAWEDARKIVDKLSIEIAKGNLQTDEASIQKWLNEQNVQTRDFEEFDYSVFKTYGDYLVSQQSAIDGLTDATIAAHMAMLKLSNVSNEATEAVTNFDENILRDAYNAQLGEAKKRDITKEDYLDYAEEMGYTYEKEYKRYGRGRGRLVEEYRDENGKKINIKEEDVRDFIVNRATNKDFTAVLQKMAEHYDSANEREQELFSEVFANGLDELSFQTLSKYGTYEDGQFGFNKGSKDAFAKAMNFESFDEMAKMLEIAPEQLAKQLEGIFTAGGAEFIKARKNLVKNMTKYSTDNKKDYEANAELLNLLEAKYKDLDVSGILTDVIGRLEATGDEEFSTAAYEAFRDIMMKAEGEAQMKEALHFLESIDLSNPIDALDKINEEIQSGSGHAKELAIAMKQSGGTFLSLSSQLTSLTEMADFEDLDEDLEEIIAKNGEIAALDVYDLADSYKSLDKILKNNEMSAAGLAKVLEGIADGTLQIEDLTDTVLAALSSFESLESIATKTVKALEDFDLGIDESTVGETVGEWADLIKENLKKGAVGNSQNFKILDYLFPGWDKGLEGDALVAEMTRLAKKLEGNGQNLRAAWSDLAAGKDYKGNKAVFDGTGMTDEEKARFDKLSVTDTGSEILFSGWEGKGLTSTDLVAWISDAYNVSSEMAAMMLTDFKNYSSDLAVELKENDYAVGIEKAYESLRSFGDLKLVDEQEIKTIAKLLGVSEGTVRADFESRGATVTQFYDDKGNIKDYQDIKQIMDVDLAGAGAKAGQKWSNSFLSAVAVGNSQGGGLVSTLDMDQLEKELKSLGITGLNADKIKQQAFEAVRDGLGEGAQVGYGKVQEVLANGDTVEVTITPNMSWEEYQQQLTKLTQQNENNALAEAIGASVSEAMSAMEITPTIDENTLIEFRSQIESAASEANPQVDVTVSEESKTAMTTAIDEVTGQQKTIPASIVVNSSNINSYLYRRTIYVDLKVGNSDLPSGSRGTTDDEFATGIQNSPRTYENALTGEEGPELIERADGTAYLTGTAGPEITKVGRGDTVYTAEETKDIFKRQKGLIMPRYATGYGSGTAYYGSGGKGPGSDKEDKWENSFDKLYNLVREIDEELRQRERIERRYEKLLESVDLTADKLYDNSVEQLKQLEKEKLLNQELRDLRRQQIYQYQMENAELTKYAKVVQNERGEDVLRIHWDQINQVEDPERGQEIEDYVGQLEEWMEDLNNVEDSLNDIEDRIEEIKEQGKDEYIDLENAIKDAIEFAYQEEIDKLSEINESINDTNTQLINAMSKQLSRIRQQRENEKTERELEEKQRQLLYLSQDTSGANDMQILQLQKDIDEQQVDYTDTLIDQKIEELEQQNEEAALQREQQIKILQTQLDYLIQTGQIWDEVYSLIDEGLDYETGLIRGSRLEQMLKNAEGFQGMSKIQQMDWLKELQQQSAQAVTYMRMTNEKLDTSIELDRQNYFGKVTSEPKYNGSSSNSSSGGGGTYGGGGGFNNGGYDSATIKKAQQFVGTPDDGMWGANSQAAAAAKGYNSLAEVIAAMNGSGGSSKSTWRIYTPGGSYVTTFTGTQAELDRSFPVGSYLRQLTTNSNISSGSNNSSSNGSNSSNSGSNNTTTTPKYTKVQVTYANGKQVTYDYNSNWKSLAEYWKKSYGGSYTYRAYKTGGLADFTGPAWLDGTKSHPELVLNQKDTQNFIQLKDILASLMTGSHISTENHGDITYDIDINVENIGNDYDIEQVANKIKSLINEDARYRNNNAVSLKR